MREIIHLTPADARRVPWKNGRGITAELALWPRDASFAAGDFDWRISKAAIDEAGPFSRFPGFDRILVVTRGEGLVLVHGDRSERIHLRRFEPRRFAGSEITTAELTAGPVSDFNVLFRTGRMQADVQVLELGRDHLHAALASEHAFVHVLSGGADVHGTAALVALNPLESLWMRELEAETTLELTGHADDSVLLLVRISSSNARPSAVGRRRSSAYVRDPWREPPEGSTGLGGDAAQRQ